MTVNELIEELEKMPKDKTIIMFDGPAYFTPSKIYVAEGFGKNIDGNVIID